MRFSLPSEPPRVATLAVLALSPARKSPVPEAGAIQCSPSGVFPFHAVQVQRISRGAGAMLALRLPPEIEERLSALDKATGRTKSFYAREAILEHLDDLEDLYLAERRLIDIRDGKTRTVPLEDVMRDYGMER